MDGNNSQACTCAAYMCSECSCGAWDDCEGCEACDPTFFDDLWDED